MKIKSRLLQSLSILSVSFIFMSGSLWAYINPAEILSKIHTANQLEITAGQMVWQKSLSPKVRLYSFQLMTHHRMTDRLISLIARVKDLQVTTLNLSQTDSDMLARIEAADKDQIDVVYLREMIYAHRRVIQDLLTDLHNLDGNQLTLRIFILNLLPVLEIHLKEAEFIFNRVFHASQNGGVVRIK